MAFNDRLFIEAYNVYGNVSVDIRFLYITLYEGYGCFCFMDNRVTET